MQEVAAEAVKTAVPLKIKPVEGKTTIMLKRHASRKGKEKMEEAAAPSEPEKEEVYDRREVAAFKPNTPFSDLGYKGIITRFNRASAQLVSQADVERLDKTPQIDRVRQLQASAAEVCNFLNDFSHWFLKIC